MREGGGGERERQTDRQRQTNRQTETDRHNDLSSKRKTTNTDREKKRLKQT